jgi:hypothetical protein
VERVVPNALAIPVIGFGEADPPEPHRFVIRHSFVIGHPAFVI